MQSQQQQQQFPSPTASTHQISGASTASTSDDDLRFVGDSKSLFQAYNESIRESVRVRPRPRESLITQGFAGGGGEHALRAPEAYTQPFCDFLTENPTVFHTVAHFEKKLEKAGFEKVWRNKYNIYSAAVVIC